jgi:hypothetical protein
MPMWDHIGALRNAAADASMGEPRDRRRLRIMAALDYAAMARRSRSKRPATSTPLLHSVPNEKNAP